jgi:hypothetical protein
MNDSRILLTSIYNRVVHLVFCELTNLEIAITPPLQATANSVLFAFTLPSNVSASE